MPTIHPQTTDRTDLVFSRTSATRKGSRSLATAPSTSPIAARSRVDADTQGSSRTPRRQRKRRLLRRSQGPGPLRSSSSPNYVALDEANGLLYISDTNNHRIRMVDLTSGDISLYAGGTNAPGPGYGDSGPATSASLSSPGAIAINPSMALSTSPTTATTRFARSRPPESSPRSTTPPGLHRSRSISYTCASYSCGIAFDTAGNAFMSGWTCGTSYAASASTGGIIKRAASNGAITVIGGHPSAGSNSVDGADATAYFLSDYSVGLPLAFGNGDLYVVMNEFNRVMKIKLDHRQVELHRRRRQRNYLATTHPPPHRAQVARRCRLDARWSHRLGTTTTTAVRMIW